MNVNSQISRLEFSGFFKFVNSAKFVFAFLQLRWLRFNEKSDFWWMNLYQLIIAYDKKWNRTKLKLQTDSLSLEFFSHNLHQCNCSNIYLHQSNFFPANFSDDVVSGLPSEVTTGIYYGWAKLENETEIRKAVVSIGWNPYYHNVKKSVVSSAFVETL